MRIIVPIFFILGVLFLPSCQKEESAPSADPQLDTDLTTALSEASNGNGLSYFMFPEDNQLNQIPQDPNNPLTAEKVELGKLLYHETGLAINPMNEISRETFSCASCHFASAGFQAGRFQGISEGGIGFGINGEGRIKGALYSVEDLDVQPIRTPTAMNGAYQSVMLWNGQFGAIGPNEGTESRWTEGTPIATNQLGFEGLETQAIAGLGVHRLDIDENLINKYPEYKNFFDAVFTNSDATKRYSKENAGLAIAAYERTLLANQAPFQKWLRGDVLAMTDLEKRGAIVFFQKANCASCHSGPALNDMDFHAIGMKDLVDIPEETFKTALDNTENFGRGGFTGKEEDNFKFKTPQLYNLADSPFYGHGSSMNRIRQVIEYKNNAIAENSRVSADQLSDQFVPQNLTAEDMDALEVFLSNALRDPNLNRYVPEVLPSGNCFPMNDPMARNELGCN